MLVVRWFITLGVILLLAIPFGMSYAEHAGAEGGIKIDSLINSAMAPISKASLDIIFYAVPVMGKDIPLIILWLMGISLFSTFYYGFINLRCLPLALRLLRGDHHSGEGHGEISNWQALSTSLSGTVGLGNIAGVAVAVSVGGPGATVWMIVMGFFGMSTKFLECALGVKYRKIDANGETSGGPMYYLEEGFKRRGLPLLGKGLAILFAFCAMGGAVGGGNMFQANQTYKMFLTAMGEGSFFEGKGWLFGILLAILTALAIIGGIKRIAKVSEKIFPAMAGLYVLSCLAIIFLNISALPDAVATIFTSAFTTEGVAGGMLGVMVAGVQRALFSNEAGLGSAPITYAATRSDDHIAQGLISMLNPFIDTVLICTVTALVIAVTGVYQGGQGVVGITLTAQAFESLGSGGIWWLALSVFLFAYSTLISWYYLGEKGFTYIYGPGKAKVMVFKVFYCLCVVAGCSAELGSIIDFTDALFFAMAIPNIIALYVMAPEIKRDLDKFVTSMKAGLKPEA